jgi:hypothetical protein
MIIFVTKTLKTSFEEGIIGPFFKISQSNFRTAVNASNGDVIKDQFLEF